MEPQHLSNLKRMNAVVAHAAAVQGQAALISYPTRVVMTICDACNFDCVMCAQDHKSGNQLTLEDYRRIEPVLDFAHTMKISGGEPLVSPCFAEIVTSCRRRGVHVAMNTNASLLKGEMLDLVADTVDEVNVSIDAATPGTYRKIRRYDFNKVAANVARLAEEAARRNRNVTITFTLVAMKMNVHEIGKLAFLASRIGVQAVNVMYMRIPQVYGHLLPESLYGCKGYSDEEMLKGKAMGQAVGVNVNLPNLFGQALPERAPGERAFCDWPWNYFEIWPDGKAAICCGGAGASGNIKQEDFLSLWNNAHRQKIRSTVNTPGMLPACRNCMVGNTMDPNNLASHLSGFPLEKAREYFEANAGSAGCGG